MKKKNTSQRVGYVVGVVVCVIIFFKALSDGADVPTSMMAALFIGGLVGGAVGLGVHIFRDTDQTP